MSIFEYDEEKEMKLIRQDEREIGMQKGIQFCVKDNLKEHVSESRILEKLQRGFSLSLEEAKRYFDLYKK